MKRRRGEKHGSFQTISHKQEEQNAFRMTVFLKEEREWSLAPDGGERLYI